MRRSPFSMARFPGFIRRLPVLALGIAALLGGSSCSRLVQTSEEAQVTRAFESWKSAVINHQTDEALAYIPHHVDAYLGTLNSGATNAAPVAPSAPAANVPASNSPGVDLLLRTALEKKVPAELRARLTLGTLLQRMTERHLFNTRDVREITLGPHVSVNGDHASAEVYYQGGLTALRLPFLKEDNVWKIDVLALLPYAEVLMRVDRAIKGETETEQIDQLVAKLPSL
jgi:hypothetical protein